MSAHPAVEVRDLRKEFIRRDGRRNGRVRRRRVAALHDVSFTLARGEIVAILGQNGSGKSTLVRVLSTLLLFEGGSAHVFGIDVNAQPRAVQRLVNRVSVEASFFKRMSPDENLSYSARFYGLTPRQTRTAIPALLTSPVLLLLDEPTTGLDPRSKLEVQALVRDLRRQHDCTILLCTHDMTEAEALADRVGILHGGRLLALDTPAEIRSRYAAETLEDAFLAATGRSFEDEAEVESEVPA